MTMRDIKVRRQTAIVLGIILVSALFHVIYFFQLKSGPCLWQHRWEETDMSFFDDWARRIAGGDWRMDYPFHPYREWHQTIAESYFLQHPERRLALEREASSRGVASPD